MTMRKLDLTRQSATRLSFAAWLLLISAAAGQETAAVTPPATEKDPKQGASAAEAPEKVAYMRIRRDEQREPLALETSVTRYKGTSDSGTAVVVDLVGAVHVGEPEYYDELNKLFKSYDAVLYELVAPEGTRVEPGQRRGNNPVSLLQGGMKELLGLEFQLDGVDYSVKNMVHADMSPEEFSASMKERGESFLGMFFRAMGQSFKSQASRKAPSDMEMLVALVAKDRNYRLKRLLAEQFEDMEGQLAAINGPDGSTIITERNRKALEVLEREIEAGKKKLAIFYGAGHLSDMAERLEKDFGLTRKNQRWLEAWKIERQDEPEDADQLEDAEAAEPGAVEAVGVGS